MVVFVYTMHAIQIIILSFISAKRSSADAVFNKEVWKIHIRR